MDRKATVAAYAGAVAAACAYLVFWGIRGNSLGSDLHRLYSAVAIPAAGVSAAAAALFVWRFWQGMFAGVSIVLFSHLGMGLAITISSVVDNSRSSPESVFMTLLGALHITGLTLILGGWFTIPLGAFLGRRLSRSR